MFGLFKKKPKDVERHYHTIYLYNHRKNTEKYKKGMYVQWRYAWNDEPLRHYTGKIVRVCEYEPGNAYIAVKNLDTSVVDYIRTAG